MTSCGLNGCPPEEAGEYSAPIRCELTNGRMRETKLKTVIREDADFFRMKTRGGEVDAKIL